MRCATARKWNWPSSHGKAATPDPFRPNNGLYRAIPINGVSGALPRRHKTPSYSPIYGPYRKRCVNRIFFRGRVFPRYETFYHDMITALSRNWTTDGRYYAFTRHKDLDQGHSWYGCWQPEMVGDTCLWKRAERRKQQQRRAWRVLVIAESGRETEITLDVPVRAGQEVTVLWGGVEGQDTGPYLMVRNEAAGTTQMVMSISGRGYGNPLFAAYASRELRMHNWFEIPSLILGICGVPYFLITFIGNLMQHGTRGPWLSELLWGFMIFFLIYKFYKLERSFPRLQQELKSEISAIAPGCSTTRPSSNPSVEHSVTAIRTLQGGISGLCIGLLLMGCARAAAPSCATHGAWSVACDNTLSCDARGFDEDSNTGAEVVFTRAAGPAARGTVTLYAPAPLARTAVRVDDRMLVLPDAAWVYAGDGASLTTDRPAAVAAFIDALRHGAALHVGANAGPVPLDGMVAALSGIDDRQGRTGGRTALVQRGPRRASAVPAAPAPRPATGCSVS
ncbi:DUF1176 domain-containing protein [Komagataeibacter sp. FXV2]|nr:DUF1176 domain-containing protein [Komagataeibacter sp. FXV2]